MSRTSFYLLLFCGLIVANIYLYEKIFASPVLEVSVRTAGKGSVTIVRTPHHQTLLIDTGSDASILRALGEVLPPWQRNIDTVVLTGDKTSFTGGLSTIKSRYRIPDPLVIGGVAASYGSQLTFDTTTLITVIAPGTFTISHGSASLLISSSTEPRTYVLK
jgi:beta-lactamase superfamily II metal-dependent hydrolase